MHIKKNLENKESAKKNIKLPIIFPPRDNHCKDVGLFPSVFFSSVNSVCIGEIWKERFFFSPLKSPTCAFL